MFKSNLLKLREKMNENNVDLAVITDDDSLYYFTGYHDFLHMDFGRPTILLVPKDDESTLITPLLDVLLVPEDAPVEKIETWNDGVGDEWREFLPKIINKKKNIACEKYKINAPVSIYLSELTNGKPMGDITPIINDIRIIKTDEELKIARHAGEVAMAMMEGAKTAMGHNVPEYEIAIAQSQAGTRKAAELLKTHYPNNISMSPNIHFLPVMASGKDLPRTHHRPTTKLGLLTKNFRGQVGDSFIITKDGYEQITHHSKEIKDLII